jgi:hypothetical protein
MGLIRVRLCVEIPEGGDGNRNVDHPWAPRPLSFLASLALHASAAFGLLLASSAADQPERHGRYEVQMLPKASDVLWMPVSETLPRISPAKAIGTAPDPQGKERGREESIVVQPPGAAPGRQFIWQPERPAQLVKEVSAPNMVAVEGAALQPTPKSFVPPPSSPPRPSLPPELIQSPDPAINALNAIQLAATSAYPLAPINVAKPKPKNFIPPQDKPRLPVQPAAIIEAPPDVALASSAVLSPRTDTPFLPGVNPANVSKPQPRRFVPPRSGGGRSPDGGQAMVFESPPTVTASEQGLGTVTAAVVGLEPGESPLPDGSRLSSFSRAPNPGEPASGQPEGGLNISIPGVSIQGGRGSVVQVPPAVPPVASRGVTFEVQIPPSAATLSAPLQPSSRRIPRLIESRFPDRAVYTLVVPRPGLPEYTSDWTLWFAEKNTSSHAAVLIRAPAPVRKITRVRTEGLGAGAADSWVQVTAVIDETGKVQAVMPLPGRNQEAALEAARDLFLWEFRPAVRNSEPIAVEVVIEMSFRSESRLAQQQ